jgi:hypothetical protein
MLAHVRAHDQVWCTTAEGIADWYYEHYFDEATAAVAAVERERS